MKRLFILTALLLSFTIQSKGQNNRTPKVAVKQEVQKKRIKQGVASGELTRAETKRLAKEQRAINRTKRKAKSDGKVTKRERIVISKMQNAASRDIKRQKNDKQSRN